MTIQKVLDDVWLFTFCELTHGFDVTVPKNNLTEVYNLWRVRSYWQQYIILTSHISTSHYQIGHYQRWKQSVLWNGNCRSNLRSNVFIWISKDEQLVIAKCTTNQHQVWIMSTQNMKQEPPSEESYWLNSLICALISSQTSFSMPSFLNFEALNKFTERKLTKRQQCKI